MVANHVWSYDFVADRTSDGKAIRFPSIIDEYTQECLCIQAARSLKAQNVSDVLFYLFNTRGMPCYIRSDNGPEFIEKELRAWFAKIGVRTAYIEPGSPWENGYIESFNEKMRDEFLNAEQLDTLHEAQILAERWRMQYNHIRPHSSRNYLPPAPVVPVLGAFMQYCIMTNYSSGLTIGGRSIWLEGERKWIGLL